MLPLNNYFNIELLILDLSNRSLCTIVCVPAERNPGGFTSKCRVRGTLAVSNSRRFFFFIFTFDIFFLFHSIYLFYLFFPLRLMEANWSAPTLQCATAIN